MADEVTTPATTPVAPTTPEVSAPAAPAPAVVEQTVSPVPTEVKSDAPAAQEPETVLGSDETPKVEAPKVEEKSVEQKQEVKTDIKPEEKPADEAKPVETKVEEKVEEAKVELPKFEWKLPEGVTVDQERVGEFNKELGEFITSNKLDGKLGQEFGQKLLDRHITEIKSVAEKVAQSYNKVWQDQTKKWFDDFSKDPEIGGNRRDTTVKAARDFIRRHGGTQEQQTALRTWFKTTGVGNYPGLIRLLANANLAKAEPRALQAEAPVPQEKLSMKQKMYGKKK